MSVFVDVLGSDLKFKRALVVPVLLILALYWFCLSSAIWVHIPDTCNVDGVVHSFLILHNITVWFGGCLLVLLTSAAWFYFTKRKIERSLCIYSLFLTPIIFSSIYFIRAYYCDGIAGLWEIFGAFVFASPVLSIPTIVLAVTSLNLIMLMLKKTGRN